MNVPLTKTIGGFVTTLEYFLLAGFLISNYYIYYLYSSNLKVINEFDKKIKDLTRESALTKQLLDSKERDLEESTRHNVTYKTNLFHINEKYEQEQRHSKTLNNQMDELSKKIELMESNHKKEIKAAEKAAREDSLKRSRAIIRGQATEHLAPFVMKDTNPKDCRFVGNPIDYILFDGLSDVTDGVSDQVASIKFIDIKTGSSGLNKVQRRIRDCINEGNITFEVINPDKDND